MGLIQDAIRRWKSQKDEKKHMENVDRWENQMQQRKLSSNERELIKFREEDRQERIKQALLRYRSRERERIWRGKVGNPAYTKNMFTHEQNIFKGGGSIMKNDPNLLKGGNMFTGNQWRKY